MRNVMNKNVIHNGKSYPKGSEILPSDDGFQQVKNSGHVDEIEGEAQAEMSAPEAAEEQQAEQPKKGKRK